MATTWDPNNKSSSETLSGGNLVATSSGLGAVAATRSLTGKTYFEVTVTTLTGTIAVGLINRSYNIGSGSILGSDNNGVGFQSSGAVKLNNATLTTLAAYAQGDVIGVAVDIANRLVWFRVNAGNWNNNVANDPATGVGGIDYSSMNLTALLPCAGCSATGAVLTGAFTTFTNAAPSGFITADTCQATAYNSGAHVTAGVLSPSTVLAARSTFQMGRGIASSAYVTPVASGLASGIIGLNYSQTIGANGGTAPYTFTLIGSLPPGLTLNGATGVISGIPTTVGNYTFSIKVTDANGSTGQFSLTIPVNPAASAAGNYGFSG